MKKLFFLAAFLLIGMTAQAQYRALSVSATNGVGLTESTTFHSLSVNFHYDVNDNWYIGKWSGISYDAENPYQQWVASDLSVNKYITDTFSLGTGIQYRYSQEDNLSDFYWTIKVQKVLRFD